MHYHVELVSVRQGASGAFNLAERGISAPRDLGLVVCSNLGFAPVSARSLTRFEWNAFADGELLAHRVVQHLSRGIPPGRVSLPVRYLSGRTF